MVVLRIVLEDLGLLLVIEIADKVIEPEILPPLLTINKPLSKTSALFENVEKVLYTITVNIHFLRKCNVELSRSQEP